MTTKEKLAVVNAYSEGKPVEAYVKSIDRWISKTEDRWDFENFEYRVKPNTTHKFEAGQTLVWKREEGKANPTFFLVEETTNEGYMLDKSEITDLETVEKEFISEKDVLWYFEWRTAKGQFTRDFEVADIHNDTIKVTKNCRLTIEEARDVVRNTSNFIEFYTMLSLGFRLKRDS